MKLGRISFLLLFLAILNFTKLKSEDKIFSSPIINLENLEPSYENLENDLKEEINNNQKLKKRNIKNSEKDTYNFVNLVGLDKITAKTKNIKIKIGETAKFGLLEIKALKCGMSNSLNNDKKESVAYIQVKDISKSQNEKVFIFNGWTFSSNPSLRPIDHAIYDIWLKNCENI